MEKIPSGFPLKKHANGQWCAYINGKRRYFGAGDPMAALDAYQKRLVGILNGDEDRENVISGKITVAQAATLFLEYLEARIKTKEITALRVTDYRRVLSVMLAIWGTDTRINTLTQKDCEKLRETFAVGCRLERLGAKIKIVNRMISWAYDSEYLDSMPKIKKWLEAPDRQSLKREKRRPHYYTSEEIHKILAAGQNTRYPKQWRALILTALNCGFGSRDLSDLTFDDIQLEEKRIDLKRGKTGTERRCMMWKETCEAISDYLATERPETHYAERVFLTSEGTLWNYNTEKSRVDSLGLAFRRITETLALKEQSFYSIRRTFRTIADEVGDVPAVNLIMGHTDYSMGGIYRQYISDDRLAAVVSHVRQWFLKVKAADND